MVDPQFKMRDGKIEPDTTRHRKSSPGFSKGALGLFENRLLEDPRFFFLMVIIPIVIAVLGISLPFPGFFSVEISISDAEAPV